MADFKTALDKTLRWEGGWADDPRDSGGCTMKGITIATYQRFFGAHKTCEDLHNIKDHEVFEIYKTGFWNVIKGTSINDQRLAEYLFDWAVNAGPSVPIKKLQTYLGVEVDGKVGPKTLAAVNAKNPDLVFAVMRDARVAFYKAIAARKPSQKVWLNGWLKRAKSWD